MLEINNLTKTRINKKALFEITEVFLRKFKQKNKEVSLALVSKNEIKKLNRNYRKIDKPTDVLSFAGEKDFLGEIIISPEIIKKQAEENKKSFTEELKFIYVHGLLHLVGLTDDKEKDRLKMIALGEKFLKAFK